MNDLKRAATLTAISIITGLFPYQAGADPVQDASTSNLQTFSGIGKERPILEAGKEVEVFHRAETVPHNAAIPSNHRISRLARNCLIALDQEIDQTPHIHRASQRIPQPVDMLAVVRHDRIAGNTNRLARIPIGAVIAYRNRKWRDDRIRRR
jgi:hypothetical protein